MWRPTMSNMFLYIALLNFDYIRTHYHIRYENTIHWGLEDFYKIAHVEITDSTYISTVILQYLLCPAHTDQFFVISSPEKKLE